MGKELVKLDILRQAWNLTKNNFLFLVPLSVILVAIWWAPEVIKTQSASLRFIIEGVSLALQMAIGVGVICVSIDIARGKSVEWNGLLSGNKYFWRYVAGSALFMVIVMVGFMLLIVPGIFWAVKYQFFSYAIVDKNMSVIDAFKESARITENVKLELFALWAMFILINILGLAVVFVGFFVAMPVVWISMALLYLQLQNRARDSEMKSAENGATSGAD